MNHCSLCSIELPKNSIIDGEAHFCCSGCHAVYHILATKNELDHYAEHPIFQQALRAGLISNPLLIEKIRRQRPKVSENELEKLHLEIAEMWCPACSELIKLLLLQEKGVYNCVVDYATDLASIEFAPRYISKEKIYELIFTLGYKPSPLNSTHQAISYSLYLRFAVAAFFALNAMMFSYPIYAAYFNEDEGYGLLFAWLSCLCAIPVVTYSAWPIFRRFLVSLKVGLLGMETLVVLGVTTAFGLSTYELFQGGIHVYFDSLTVIIAFVLLGKIIESKAKFSAKTALLTLVRAIPKRGRKRLSNGEIEFVLLKEIAPEDIVCAYSGEKIVLDGIVIEGHGTCDESLMTGEAIPVAKQVGSKLIAGTILQTGSLAFRVTSSAEESSLFKIVEMIQKEIGHKSVYVRAADPIVRWFVPAILSIAILTGLLTYLLGITDIGRSLTETAVIRTISILLISCPCAIGIAAPLAESHVINRLAKLGAIVRNRGCLALFGNETALVFDKTGTVTEGHFRVLHGLENLSEQQLKILKSMTAHSSHPISTSITQFLEEPYIQIDSVEELAGHGLQASVDGTRYYLGSANLLRMQGIDALPSHAVEDKDIIHTTVYFAEGNRCLTAIILGDRLRNDVIETLSEMRSVKKILLSGDNTQAVERVGRCCGFDEWYAEYTPLQKREFIHKLRQEGCTVCMIGDGINDAPALSAAHIGVSVVSATDISIQVSDILLTTDRLKVLPQMRSLAAKGDRIVQQNLFWAFFYNVIGIGLAALGYLSPIFAAFAMMSSSLMVLFNAKRLDH